MHTIYVTNIGPWSWVGYKEHCDGNCETIICLDVRKLRKYKIQGDLEGKEGWGFYALTRQELRDMGPQLPLAEHMPLVGYPPTDLPAGLDWNYEPILPLKADRHIRVKMPTTEHVQWAHALPLANRAQLLLVMLDGLTTGKPGIEYVLELCSTAPGIGITDIRRIAGGAAEWVGGRQIRARGWGADLAAMDHNITAIENAQIHQARYKVGMRIAELHGGAEQIRSNFNVNQRWIRTSRMARAQPATSYAVRRKRLGPSKGPSKNAHFSASLPLAEQNRWLAESVWPTAQEPIDRFFAYLALYWLAGGKSILPVTAKLCAYAEGTHWLPIYERWRLKVPRNQLVSLLDLGSAAPSLGQHARLFGQTGS